MSLKLSGPIPGESLTRELGNAPWEQPPLYAKPEQALANHFKQMTKGNNMDDLLFLVGEGFPIDTFVDSLLTTSVMEGYHTLDVSTLIAPALHEFIKQSAQSAGISYTEFSGPTPEEQDRDRFKQRLNIKLSKNLPFKPSSSVEGGADPFTPPIANNPPEMATGGQVGKAAPIPMGPGQASNSPPPVESLGPNQGYVQKRVR